MSNSNHLASDQVRKLRSGALVGSNGQRPIRVMLVDDHSVIRQALRMLLENQPGIEVIADVENGREAVAAAERLHPDIVLMDLVMPGLNGLEATRQICRISPSTKVVVLSGFVDEDQLIAAVGAGAAGYLVKKSGTDELMLAIQSVHRGNRYFSSSLQSGFDLSEVLYQAKRGRGRSSADRLTPREREVLQLIAEGYTNQGIATELVISVKTVEAHKSHIMAKLHGRNRTDLIRYALRKGIVKLESVEEEQRVVDSPGP